MIQLNVMIVFMILCSLAAIEMKDLFSAVISFGSIGLGLSVCFLFLKAPDLAIVQLVVEILVLVVLIRGTVSRDSSGYERREWFTYTAFGIFVVVFLAMIYNVLNDIPGFGYPLMRLSRSLLMESFQKTGSPNIVVSILLDYRAYDTLAAITVFFASIMGVVTIMRKIGHKK